MAELDPKPVEPIEPVEALPADEVVVEENVQTADTSSMAVVSRPRNVYAGMWGPVEIAVVSAGALAVLGAMLVYFFFVIPSNRQLAHNKTESERLNAELISAKSKYGDIISTESQVGKLLTSVDDFETRYLPTVSTGQSALYQRLNGLIRGYGLVNTTGPDYAPLETVDSNAQQTDEDKGRSKYRSLYPGVYVTMTVEGSYANLRRFIREVETGSEFVVISAVELAPSDNESRKEAPPPDVKPINPNKITVGPNGVLVQDPNAAAQAGRPKGKTHGENLALHLEMAAYFRRPGFTPLATRSAEQQ